MEAKYFNSWEFKQALDLTETDPLYARVLYEQYVKKYPRDYSAYLYYCSLLITLGELDLAEKMLNYIKIEFNTDKAFKQFDKKNDTYKTYIFTKLKLLSYQGKYEELYNCCMQNIKEIKIRNMNSVLFYAMKQTGRLNPDKRDENSYLFKQLVRYEETDFLNHIKKHLAEYNENIENPNSNIFVPGFPIEKVIEEVKKHIPNEKRLYWGFYDDIYCFKYDGCGRQNSKLVNYFKVICVHDTKEFITMCPVVGSENFPHIDLNYMKEESEGPKVKRLSQIDKFNKKYNIKK